MFRTWRSADDFALALAVPHDQLTSSTADPGGGGGHRDVELLRSLPGVGRTPAATMLAEASQLLARRDYQGLRAYAGTAPVTRQSGKNTQIRMRYGCNHCLRNVLHYWSQSSVKSSCKKPYCEVELRNLSITNRACIGRGNRNFLEFSASQCG